jgi:hypothetical protein
MLREHLTKKGRVEKNSFRWRGAGEIARIEGFSDAVFAFAVTLLVVSLEVPETFTELWEKMHGFVAFMICFALLFLVWHDQYTFFRRYGLQDGVTNWLNGALLFVVLFFVYPLKFLFTMLTRLVTGAGLQVHLPNGEAAWMIERGQMPLLMIIYSLGYIAVSLIFVLLYIRAYRKRAELDLNEGELIETRSSLQAHLLNIGIGTLSLLVVFIGGAGSEFWAGAVYWLIGPVQGLNGWIMGKKKQKLKMRLSS